MKYYRVEPKLGKSQSLNTKVMETMINSIQFDAEEMYRWGYVDIHIRRRSNIRRCSWGHYNNDNNVADFDSSDI
jgi:hypothetical protein